MAARFSLAAAFAVLVACSPQQQSAATAEKPGEATEPQVALTEPLDPFIVMVDAERWGVIIDKAREGVREAPDPNYDARAENELYRADSSLKSSAAALIELRNAVCDKGMLKGADCELKNWPAWTMEPPTDKTPIVEIQRRSDWLSTQMDRFTTVGCEAGRKSTNDYLFCSVE